MSKVLVVGLDGATWDIIRPLVAEGRLPTMARLLDEGASGIMQSTIPPTTPVAWTTFFTGKNPGKHGIFDFQKLDPETYEFETVRANRHREKTVWQLLGEAGYRSIIMDVPFTYPPQPFNGLMITGYGTPRTSETTFTYPTNLADRLPAALQSEVRVALPSNRFDRSQRFIDEWREIMEGRRRLVTHLLAEEPWDFFMVVFSITDMMAHTFWTYVDPAHPNYYKAEAEEYREAFFHAYEMCDRLLKEMMIEAGDSTTTIVLSDHGFGSTRPRQYIFQRLIEGGYIQAKQSKQLNFLGNRLMKTAVNIYTRFPILREWIKGLHPPQRRMFKKTLRRAGALPNPGSVDFPRSKVVVSDTGQRFWINERGRFSCGFVAPNEKEGLLDELSSFLRSDRDPVTGEPVVAATYRGEELYHGPVIEQAPDLVIVYTNLFDSNTRYREKNPHVEGGHTQSGIFLAHGPSVKATVVEQARLLDLTPTILHLFDEAIPPDMDGRVLTEIHTDDFLADQPVRTGETPATLESAPETLGSGYTAEEEAEIEEQLRQLGYIE